LIAVVTPAAAAGWRPDAVTIGRTTSAEIENYVQQQASASHIPGVAVGIVQDGRPTLVKGFGDAGPDTSFDLASLSKSFTAVAIMQLVGQGKVSLDAPVRRYIPWFKIGDGGESDSMTVLQLLDQTSGISKEAGLTELNFTSTTTYGQAIRGFERYPLTARPGRLFQYSNANYTIAGYIVQEASGQSYESYVQQHIFAPLGMTHTYAMTNPVRGPGYTKGNVTWFGLKVPVTDQIAAPLAPAGGIVSSASDMLHYLMAQMNGGVYDGTRIVTAKAVQEMHAALAPMGPGVLPNTTSYGLGWGVGTINGTPLIGHEGQAHDFDTAMAVLPKKKTAVIVLMNEDPELVGAPDQLYEGIMQGLTTGTFPSVSRIFFIFYALFDAIVLATLILMVRSLWRTGSWLRKFGIRARRHGFWRVAVLAIGLDLGMAALIAVGVSYGIGSLYGDVPLTPTVMMFGGPDVAVWVFALILFFAVRAVVRTVGILATRAGSWA
jgi:CubicO group peptidase (beta-lactamase class C family)